jgi:hypothetical protein
MIPQERGDKGDKYFIIIISPILVLFGKIDDMSFLGNLCGS